MHYPKGSEWRKWDLHIHTPLSIEQNYGGDKPDVWDKFIEHLEKLPEEVKVIGINDYYFIDGYEKVMRDYRFKGRLKNIEKIFPLLEFRIDTFGTANQSELQKVNLHILFDIDENDFVKEIKRIKEEFIDRINLSGLDIHSTKKLSKENFISCSSNQNLQTGFSEIIPSTSQVFEIISSDTWKNKTFLLLGYKEWHNLEKGNQLKPFKDNLYNKVHAFFTASKDDNTSKKEEVLKRFGDKKLLHSSDIHGFEALKNYQCFTWIKADPTFEGLKQLLFEPERIKIQETHPQEEFKKSYFSKIIIDETPIFANKKVRFKTTHIELNPNLVAIIGGRGSGKSILLNAIAKMFKKNKNNSRVDDISIENNFMISYTKQDGTCEIYDIKNENNLDYLHVHQSEVKDIVEKPEQLHKEIKAMLGLKESKYDEKIEAERRLILNKLQEINDWFYITDKEGNLVNSKAYNEKMIKQNEDFINTVTTKKNAELINNYRDNNIILGLVETSKKSLEELKQKIDQFSSEIQSEIEKVNELIEEDNEKIPDINLTPQITAINNLLKQKEQKINTIKATNETIKLEFQRAGIEGDITSLLEKVKMYQEEIESFKNKIKEIEQKDNELQMYRSKRDSIADQLRKELLEEVKEIEDAWKKLLEGKEGWSPEQKEIINELLNDIEIYGDINFDDKLFYDKIGGFLNKSKFRATANETSEQKIRKTLNINNFEDFLKLLKNEKIINFNGEYIGLQEFLQIEDLFLKNGEKELLSFLFLRSQRSAYLSVISKTKYKGKEPYELSVGQRGTFYICLKLATDPFLTPFIFDQPEDDLDNSFIMEQLVPIFKKIKKYRQIIVVTHNANIVVNADAEQIIVANNEGEQLSYFSGSLEHSLKNRNSFGIREHVCNILEGGEQAFKNRELKYGINKKTVTGIEKVNTF